MNKPRYLVFDTLDDRKEIIYLLEKLPPWKRIAWLKGCCAQAVIPNSKVRPRVAARTAGEVTEIYLDFWVLSAQYQLDVDASVLRLVDMVKYGDGNIVTVARLARIESALRLKTFGARES
jgi:hypothetical protein